MPRGVEPAVGDLLFEFELAAAFAVFADSHLRCGDGFLVKGDDLGSEPAGGAGDGRIGK